MKATWENTLLAESDKTIVVEGNHYFPPESVKQEYFRTSEKQSTCPLERACQLLSRSSRRKSESRCCLVLPGTEGGC